MKSKGTRLLNILKLDTYFPEITWFVMAFCVAVSKYFFSNYNNYRIFKGVFWHTIHQQDLYQRYPSEYYDSNHYGPFFSIVIAPFAVLPDLVGIVCWCMLNAFLLFYAIKKSGFISPVWKLILLITAIEMTTALHGEQVNPIIAACLIFAFVFIEKGKDFWASFFIAGAFMVKLYGLAGLLFFVFSKNKKTFALSFIFWVAVMFALPMLFSSPSFILHSYEDWWQSLSNKNLENLNYINPHSFFQDISLTGFLRRSFGLPAAWENWILIPASLLVLAPLLRFNQYVNRRFRLSYLALALISVVLLSTSAESPTYVIAVTGCGIWFFLQPANKFRVFLLVIMLFLTSLATTDLLPHYFKDHFMKPYSLKALPCILIWFDLIFELSFRDFSGNESNLNPV